MKQYFQKTTQGYPKYESLTVNSLISHYMSV